MYGYLCDMVAEPRGFGSGGYLMQWVSEVGGNRYCESNGEWSVPDPDVEFLTKGGWRDRYRYRNDIH